MQHVFLDVDEMHEAKEIDENQVFDNMITTKSSLKHCVGFKFLSSVITLLKTKCLFTKNNGNVLTDVFYVISI